MTKAIRKVLKLASSLTESYSLFNEIEMRSVPSERIQEGTISDPNVLQLSTEELQNYIDAEDILEITASNDKLMLKIESLCEELERKKMRKISRNPKLGPRKISRKPRSLHTNCQLSY